MTKFAALALGAVTILPLAYLFFFFAVLFILVFGAGNPSPKLMPVLFVAHGATIFFIWSLIVFYIWHLFKTEFVAADKKALWAVVLVLGSALAMPIFWYFYIWKPANADAGGPKSQK